MLPMPVRAAAPPPPRSNRSALLLAGCLLVCGIGAGWRITTSNERAETGRNTLAAATAQAWRADLAQVQRAADAALAALERGEPLAQAQQHLGAAEAAGYVLLGPNGQPAAASDAGVVAPAREAAAAAQAARAPAVLLQDQGLAAVARTRSTYTAVLLLRAPIPASGVQLAAKPSGAALQPGEAPVGFGLIVRAADPAQRWLELLLELLIAFAPIALAAKLISDHIRAQAVLGRLRGELERARKRFRIAVNGAGAGVFEFSANAGGSFHISARLRAILGAGGEHLSREEFLDRVTEADRAAVRAGLERAVESGVLEIAFRVNARAGAWVEMRGLAVEDPGLGAVRIIGTGLDDTPRREAEARASAMERRLRAAIDGYTGPFALWDARRRLVTCNVSFVEAFRLTGVAAPGVDYGLVAKASTAAIQRQQHDPNDANVRELELVNGIWLKLVERPTPDGGLVSIAADITALKQQERMLRSAAKEMRQKVTELERLEGRNRELAKKYEQEKHRAEDASRAKSLFLANMSHELRTPLNAIIGFSEIISSELLGELGNAKYKEYSLDIYTSGQLLLDLINDILDMAKIEAGKWTLALSAVDPEETITQVVRLMSRRAEERGLQIVVDSQALPTLEADQRALKQILLNLLSNAVKFTEEGGVMVRARSVGDGGGVSITVADTGPGIPREYLPRLARPFEQVHIAGASKGGTGLGLALTRALAEMHGGAMHIESELGRGTAVTVTLPLRPPVHAPEEALEPG
jgi:two-component system cell cycle sensor histidine kinase PleC